MHKYHKRAPSGSLVQNKQPTGGRRKSSWRWSSVLKLCVEALCWSYVLKLCVEAMCWSSVLKLCVVCWGPHHFEPTHLEHVNPSQCTTYGELCTLSWVVLLRPQPTCRTLYTELSSVYCALSQHAELYTLSWAVSTVPSANTQNSIHWAEQCLLHPQPTCRTLYTELSSAIAPSANTQNSIHWAEQCLLHPQPTHETPYTGLILHGQTNLHIAVELVYPVMGLLAAYLSTEVLWVEVGSWCVLGRD